MILAKHGEYRTVFFLVMIFSMGGPNASYPYQSLPVYNVEADWVLVEMHRVPDLLHFESSFYEIPDSSLRSAFSAKMTILSTLCVPIRKIEKK
ncbi:hypothetical protein BDP27DRAFT_86725 [Rhodocollybia butyracea]|uniref:Uncharacterized protein n=1 Tax=Rhodocollybia butyracea TaxID=206335 RepID=A0A9P5PYI8_9AGAR|nr:hypothetical protein BDP27DRAFT_86725 [Rhodocollybia butyracea]